MSFFHLHCSCDKITQEERRGWGLFERQMNSYTPLGSLSVNQWHGGFPRSEAASPALIGEMMPWQIVDHLVMFLKMQLCFKKKKKRKREREHKH